MKTENEKNMSFADIKPSQGMTKVEINNDLELSTSGTVIKQEIVDEAEEYNFVDSGHRLKTDVEVGEQALVKQEYIEENTLPKLKPNNGGLQEEARFATNNDPDLKEFDFVDCGEFSETDIKIREESLVEENQNAGQFLKCKQQFNLLKPSYVETTQLECSSVNKPHKCEICDKEFLQKGALLAHMRIHSGEKPFKCEICNSRFNHTSNLKAHVRAHSGIKEYKCKLCNKYFAKKNHLNSHIRAHNGVKEYKCEICDVSFIHRNNLNAHIRAHSGIKKYKCEECNKYFIKRSHLNDHIQVHTGIKLFKCKICGKDFSRNSVLTIHIQTHSGVKPYECKTCGKRFLRKGQLTRHFKVHMETN